jgi:hypothetical protein
MCTSYQCQHGWNSLKGPQYHEYPTLLMITRQPQLCPLQKVALKYNEVHTLRKSSLQPHVCPLHRATPRYKQLLTIKESSRAYHSGSNSQLNTFIPQQCICL